MNVIQCAPAPAHTLLAPDPQFYKEYNNAITPASLDGEGEMRSKTGLSFDDYMQMQTTKKSFTRRKPVPQWPFDPVMLRKVLVRYFCSRAFEPRSHALSAMRKAGLTDAEMLKKAMARLEERIPRKVEVLDCMCHEYMLLKHSGQDPVRMKRLHSLIRGVDGDLRMCVGTAPATIAAVIYRSYNLNEDSPAVGAALGIMPTAVRQLLFRLNKCYKALQEENGPGDPRP